MAFDIEFSFSRSGATLAVTLERVSDGFFWNPTTAVFEASPAYLDKRIGLPEDSGAENAGGYSVTVDSLGSPGLVRVRIHDEDTGNFVLDKAQTTVIGSQEVIDTADADTIADHTLRRQYANVRASLHGDSIDDRSLLGSIAWQVNRVAPDGEDLVAYHEDDLTEAARKTTTKDITALPIIEVDPI
jgi:hypothetical protein